MYPVKFVRYGLRGQCRGVENGTTMRHHTPDPLDPSTPRPHLLSALTSISHIPLTSYTLYLPYSILDTPFFYGLASIF